MFPDDDTMFSKNVAKVANIFGKTTKYGVSKWCSRSKLMPPGTGKPLPLRIIGPNWSNPYQVNSRFFNRYSSAILFGSRCGRKRSMSLPKSTSNTYTKTRKYLGRLDQLCQPEGQETNDRRNSQRLEYQPRPQQPITLTHELCSNSFIL